MECAVKHAEIVFYEVLYYEFIFYKKKTKKITAQIQRTLLTIEQDLFIIF